MKLNILKRIEALEKKARKSETPDLIMIFYEPKDEKWTIREDYCKHDNKGNIVAGGHSKTIMVDHYKDYIIPAGFEGTLLLSLMECPNGGDLFIIKAKEIKQELKVKGCGLSLEYAGKEGHEGIFNVTVHSYAE